MRPRLIPILLLSGGGLVKTKRFCSPRYVGDPINAVKIFNEKEVDELIILDIQATRLGNNPDYKILEDISSEAFMPMSYGGGVKNLSQAEKIFAAGFEKIAVRHSFGRDIKFASELAKVFGSQAVVGSVDIKPDTFGELKSWDYITEEFDPRTLEEVLAELEQSGVGEILLTNVNLEGTRIGLDFAAVERASRPLGIPLIINGGLNSVSEAASAVCSGADAVGAGALFVFNGPHEAVLISYPQQSELVSTFDRLKDC